MHTTRLLSVMNHTTPRLGLPLLVAICLATALVCFRSAVSLASAFLFDSDQAVVGLMAKHFSEFRTFPLFFYGQHYMLGVQSWIAAPFFLVGGPTISMLRLPLLIWGVVVAAAFIFALARQGLSATAAFTAALPLIATTPVVSLELMTALGASIEPFAWILLIWYQRRRPFAVGALTAFATLHREFTIFALPALALVHWRSYRSWIGGTGRGLLGAASVWCVIAFFKQYTNTLGPTDGVLQTGSLSLQAHTIARFLSFDPRTYSARMFDVLGRGLPDMLGLGQHPVDTYGVPGTMQEGSSLGALLFASAITIAAIRLSGAKLIGEYRDGRLFGFLAFIGGFAVLAYGLNGGILPGYPVVLRYLLFALMLPVALFGGFFLNERKRKWRFVVCALVVGWATLNIYDNYRLWHHYAASPPDNNKQALADYLLAHHIRYGRADYWDAYSVTFLTQERVILSSTSKVRIEAYQSAVEAHADEAVTIVRQPCASGVSVASWCIVPAITRSVQ